MNKEQILESLEEFSKESPNPYLDSYRRDYSSDPDLGELKCFTSEAWTVGGKTGGNCWHSAYMDVEEESEKDITLLDSFLEKYNFKLNFSQSKKLIELIQEQDWSDYEYYGNYTRYKCAYITFEDLAEYLSHI